eukprot:2515561-Karenia_brevis.AAC.1
MGLLPLSLVVGLLPPFPFPYPLAGDLALLSLVGETPPCPALCWDNSFPCGLSGHKSSMSLGW